MDAMRVFGVEDLQITEELERFYNRTGSDGYTMTGEVLHMGDAWGVEKTGYIVFKGGWTRTGTVRDCGDHYIYAGYSKYYRIDKETLEITEDVKDV